MATKLNDKSAEDLTNIRHDPRRTFKEKKRDYMKAKVNKLEENIKYNNIREMHKVLINSKININLAHML